MLLLYLLFRSSLKEKKEKKQTQQRHNHVKRPLRCSFVLLTCNCASIRLLLIIVLWNFLLLKNTLVKIKDYDAGISFKHSLITAAVLKHD